MVDHDLIQRKLILLEESAAQIKKLGLKSFASFKKQYAIQKAAEKILQEMIETCLDIGKHIISDQRLRSPDDYRDIFTVLGEEKILPQKAANTMRQMVGFRNIIIHMYEKIDLELVFTSATKRLGDFDTFSKYILKFLSKAR